MKSVRYLQHFHYHNKTFGKKLYETAWQFFRKLSNPIVEVCRTVVAMPSFIAFKNSLNYSKFVIHLAIFVTGYCLEITKPIFCSLKHSNEPFLGVWLNQFYYNIIDSITTRAISDAISVFLWCATCLLFTWRWLN